MTQPTNPTPNVPDPEAAYGGADAIEKTTYVVGTGTDPRAMADGKTPPPVGKTGMTLVAWAVIIVAVLIAIAYLVGIFNK
jgi:hypothetical protein